MDIPNYDFNEDENTNFKQLYKYMPKSNFRMLICGNSGSGKTNLLFHILMKPLVYYDQIHLYFTVWIFTLIYPIQALILIIIQKIGQITG